MSDTTAPVHEFNPYKIPREYLAAIGLVAACSAQTETVLKMLLGACIGVDMEYGSAVSCHMTAPLRDSVIRAAAEIRLDSTEALDELDALLDAVKSALDKRNDIVHHSLYRDVNTGEIFRVKETARGSVKVDVIPVTVDQIELDAKAIYDGGLAIMQFMMKHGLEPRPMPTRPRGHKLRAARKAARKQSGK